MSYTLPEWPSTLPLEPLVDGYSETWPSQTQYMTPSNGAPMVRRKSVMSLRALQVKFVLTPKQLLILDDFIYNTLAGGTYRFQWYHPRTKELVEASFYGKDTSTDIITIGEPKGTQLPNRPESVMYEVTTTIVIWP